MWPGRSLSPPHPAVQRIKADPVDELGRPVDILLPFAPDWRWLTGRADSPWYPTARLFRQARPNEWTGALADLAQALHSPAR